MTEYETNMISVISSGCRIRGGIDIFLKSTSKTIKQNVKNILTFTEEGEVKFKVPLEDIGFVINERELTLRQVKTIIIYLEALEDRD